MGHLGELYPFAAGGGMNISRRGFLKAIIAAPGVALAPVVVEAAPLHSLSVADAIQYLCNDVFALPAERAARIAAGRNDV
ncbi:hypothetical protein PSAC2689_200029 [Paraburkholderia sacchari]